MKSKFILLALIVIGIIACKNKPTKEQAIRTHFVNGASPAWFQFIPMDSANKMIGSYLNSIHYNDNDTDLRALIVSADQLRQYMDDTAGGKVKYLKLFFAHTLDYIAAGHGNQPAGYKSGALTLVVAAYDSSGSYIYHDENKVLEYCMPCPNSCPLGAAGNSFLTQ